MTAVSLSFLFPLLCLILSLVFPRACAAGVEKGLFVALGRALPALFPSLVVSYLLPRFWPRSKKGRPYLPLFVGLFCGFPTGAVTVGEMVKKGQISPEDGEKMLLFCNNAGPAFWLSYCGTQILHSQKAALFLYLVQSFLSVALFLLFFGRKEKNIPLEKGQSRPSLLMELPRALRAAAHSFLYIASCIIFFSFLAALARLALKRGPWPVLFALFLEITGGTEELAGFAPRLALPLCALACGWGGLSVHLQTAGVLESSGLRLSFHTAGRALFALILLLSALFFTKLL